MESLKILFLCVAAAIVYGILQDQITARVCVEYFTIGHPPIFQTNDPTTLALGWGVLATWWVGVLLGLPLALIARWPFGHRLTARELVKPILLLIACVGVVALLSGIAGFRAARSGLLQLFDPLAFRVPPEKQVAFLADGAAHTAAYATGFVGGVVVWVLTWRKRKALARADAKQPWVAK